MGVICLVINGDSDKEISEIPVGKGPTAIDFTYEKIYVANRGSDTVSVINATNDKKEISEIPVGKGLSIASVWVNE